MHKEWMGLQKGAGALMGSRVGGGGGGYFYPTSVRVSRWVSCGAAGPHHISFAIGGLVKVGSTPCGMTEMI